MSIDILRNPSSLTNLEAPKMGLDHVLVLLIGQIAAL